MATLSVGVLRLTVKQPQKWWRCWFVSFPPLQSLFCLFFLGFFMCLGYVPASVGRRNEEANEGESSDQFQYYKMSENSVFPRESFSVAVLASLKDVSHFHREHGSSLLQQFSFPSDMICVQSGPSRCCQNYVYGAVDCFFGGGRNFPTFFGVCDTMVLARVSEHNVSPC